MAPGAAWGVTPGLYFLRPLRIGGKLRWGKHLKNVSVVISCKERKGEPGTWTVGLRDATEQEILESDIQHAELRLIRSRGPLDP